MASEATDRHMEDVSAQAGDVEMGDEPAGGEEDGAEGEVEAEGEEVVPSRISFLTYLTSPIVSLLIGNGAQQTLLTAHQALLAKSPYFQEACRDFVADGSTIVALMPSWKPRQIELPNEDTEAVGGFLEYLYTGEYFPRKIPGSRSLESDPSLPSVDDSGEQLLKHARIYTLAEKLGVDPLKALASSKIHCVDSTAKGEINYARYVYAHTKDDDQTVRAPIASFWATRSHTLRSEAEDEFKALCLEHPRFGYDVLTRVLDEKLRREKMDKQHPGTGSVRKRPRHSSGGGAS